MNGIHNLIKRTKYITYIAQTRLRNNMPSEIRSGMAYLIPSHNLHSTCLIP